MYDMEFTIMHKNKEVEEIKVNFSSGEIEYKNIIDEIPLKQFNKKPDLFQIFDWLEERSYPRNRTNVNELLREIGLTHYDPKEIVKKTHGVMWEDFICIKFKDEEIRWEDVRLR